MSQSPARIAVIVPCYNEEAAISRVVRDFRAALPGAEIYVYDNLSSDGTAERAREAGAVVRQETRRGKGNVVRRMFADVEADIYVLVDGDDTYDAAAAAMLVRTLVEGGYDIVSGRRVAVGEHAYRAGHVLGNKIFTGITALLFRINVSDMLSGYRVMSRRFVKSFPVTAEGFGIETELTVHAVRLLMPMIEIDTAYKERPAGSISKLHTWGDGFRILFTIVALVREERPLVFFTGLFVLLAAASLIVGTPVVVDYFRTGLVPRLPSAVLATALMLLGFLSLASGLILDTVTRGRWELKRTAYLRIPGPGDLLLP